MANPQFSLYFDDSPDFYIDVSAIHGRGAWLGGLYCEMPKAKRIAEAVIFKRLLELAGDLR